MPDSAKDSVTVSFPFDGQNTNHKHLANIQVSVCQKTKMAGLSLALRMLMAM